MQLKQTGVTYYILRRRMVRRILDSKGAFYKGTESDNNDESYNENNEQQQ